MGNKALQIFNRNKDQYRRPKAALRELFVNTPGAFIGKRGERVFVRIKQAVAADVPVIRLNRITVAGQGVSLSSDVIRLCAERDINISFLDGLGKTYSVARSPDGAAVELVLLQIRHRESSKGRYLAYMFVIGKMKNQLSLLKSYMKYKGHGKDDFGREFVGRRQEMEALIGHARKLCDDTMESNAEFRQVLMGLEGRFAAHYWHLIRLLLPDEAGFSGRITKGSKDLVNALLNYGYGILYNQVSQTIHQVGLNTAAGFLHTCHYSQSSLVYDMVEEFRASVVDRPVFSLLNRRQTLSLGEDGLLVVATRKKLTRAVLKRLGQTVNAKGRCDTLQQFIYTQALAVKDFLIDKGVYRPFLARW